jgi:hypothetical protein
MIRTGMAFLQIFLPLRTFFACLRMPPRLDAAGEARIPDTIVVQEYPKCIGVTKT